MGLLQMIAAAPFFVHTGNNDGKSSKIMKKPLQNERKFDILLPTYNVRTYSYTTKFHERRNRL